MSDVTPADAATNGFTPTPPVDLLADLGPLDSLTYTAEVLAELGAMFGRMAATEGLSDERVATFGLCAVVASTAGAQVAAIAPALELLEGGEA